MAKQFLVLLMVVFSFQSYSQIYFENGYFIDNYNEKTECQIKNVDWKNNPKEFEFRMSETSEINKKSIKSIKEFGVYNASKYIRQIVEIDRSSENINNLTYDKNPIFLEEELFLKVIVEGKSTLYEYIDGNLTRFFYKINNVSDVEQLIFKKYSADKKIIHINYGFRHQLWNHMKCTNFKMSKFENLNYNKKELVKFFKEHSKCHNSNINYFEPKQKKDLFNLTIRPRLDNSSLTTQNANVFTDEKDFGSNIGLGLGVEVEFIAPFNKNKWSVIIEPIYQSFNFLMPNDSSNSSTTEFNSNLFKLSLGVRHYFFLNNNSKLFLNASVLNNLNSKHSVTFSRTGSPDINHDFMVLKGSLSIGLGLGFKVYDKFSLELNYTDNKETLASLEYSNTNHKTLSMIFGYSFF